LFLSLFLRPLHHHRSINDSSEFESVSWNCNFFFTFWVDFLVLFFLFVLFYTVSLFSAEGNRMTDFFTYFDVTDNEGTGKISFNFRRYSQCCRVNNWWFIALKWLLYFKLSLCGSRKIRIFFIFFWCNSDQSFYWTSQKNGLGWCFEKGKFLSKWVPLVEMSTISDFCRLKANQWTNLISS